ncbi:MAG: EF-P lysine aminoacylase GenX [Methyloprofundus sp.]|nr:EF-P lysine aminoacylase GenX [Methyloprofundus sp.]
MNTQSIYQICKAFRQGESGRFHNPEFTMLEWYRVGFNLQQLMDDVELLLSQFLPIERFPDKAERIGYQHIFAKYTGLNALQFDLALYQTAAEKLGYPEALELCASDHAAWLDFLFSHCVQPHLAKSGLCMVYDYPACLPSLARLKQGAPLLVERVEVFIQGVELGNGYFELSDVKEQIKRFKQDILLRKQNGTAKIDMDKRFLAALQSGLPDCAGIAIGLDRLLMIISEKNSINEVLAFSIKNA